jgi:signal transduction histidine kinase
LKLLTKTTLFFLTIALFVLFTGGIVFYFSFRYMMNREVKKELVTEMHQIIMNPQGSKISAVDALIFDLPLHYQVTPISEIKNAGFVFSDTLLFDNILNSYQAYRIISYETLLDQKPVRISISKSLLLSDEIIEYVAFVILALSLLLLFFIIGLNNYFFSQIWSNFFKTIELIKDYSISENRNITFAESEITEFNQLNSVFEKMNERIRKDYQNLKEFIENISHEIQNPLAIIKSRIDLLQQSETLNKSQAELIQSIQNSTIRLSNLNKSLILLSKIDNNQFSDREEVDIVENIKYHLNNFEDIIKTKKITLKINYGNQIKVMADPNLISILLLNLLKNSIYHNLPSGNIEITTGLNTLIIRNTGKELDISPEDLFKRFTKSSNKPESLGLGLAIVKKISDYYHFTVNYTFRESTHIISIIF